MKKRVLLKISGEALMGNLEYGIDQNYMDDLVKKIIDIKNSGVEVAVVLGGGNIFRGVKGISAGMDAVSAHHMGMLAIHINGVAFTEAIRRAGGKTVMFSPFDIPMVSEKLNKYKALEYLQDNKILVFVGGAGIPYFTSDTSGVLSALEIEADMIIKATQVDGLYDKDPNKYDDAQMIEEATYEEVISENLKVMDTSAFAMARDNNLEIRIVSLNKDGAILRAINGEKEGSVIR
ncbi:MAG: UMP kinase [Candidatus Gracilibacteria bacterium]|nr:UMP kinase [Candidatus Gracilibacteria bacterium]